MAKKFQPEYSLSDIIELYRIRSTDDDEGRLQSLAKQLRTYTRLEHEVTIPPEYKGITKQFRTPFIRDAWQRISSSLVAKTPVPHITPKNENRKEYRDSASIAERALMAMIERFNKQFGIDINYFLTAQLVRDGESILKVVHRPSAWANFPERVGTEDQDNWKKSADLPIAWRDVDRLTVLYEGGEYGDEWVLEYGEYTKPFLKSRYGMIDYQGSLVDPKSMLAGKPYAEGLNPSSQGRAVKMEFFTPREWHVIVDGADAPGFPKRNPYSPHLPYFRASAYDKESLLFSLLYLVPRLDELLTMKFNWGVLGAYPSPVLETLPNSDAMPALDGPFGNTGNSTEGAQNAVVWRPGKLIDLPIGRKLSFLVPPPVGQDLNDLIQIVKNLIDVAGIPSVMRGMSSPGDSGYLANQLRAAAAMAYRLAALSLQRQLEQAAEFSFWLISNVIRQTVYVKGWSELNPKTFKPAKNAHQQYLGLSPDKATDTVADISKLGQVGFQYRPITPTDAQAQAMIALQLTNAARPLLDVRHALENYLQEEDPDSIIDAIALQGALDEEPLRSQVLEAALREAGMLPEPPPEPVGLVDQFGQPMANPALPPPPGGIQNVPLENMPQPGMPGLPGVTMPMQPAAPQPQGIPGNPGGRPPGVYPGQPGNQGPV